jgi:hypothetical protein
MDALTTSVSLAGAPFGEVVIFGFGYASQIKNEATYS